MFSLCCFQFCLYFCYLKKNSTFYISANLCFKLCVLPHFLWALMYLLYCVCVCACVCVFDCFINFLKIYGKIFNHVRFFFVSAPQQYFSGKYPLPLFFLFFSLFFIQYFLIQPMLVSFWWLSFDFHDFFVVVVPDQLFIIHRRFV